MYIWAELPEFYKSMGSVEFSKRLLEKAKVAVSPASVSVNTVKALCVSP